MALRLLATAGPKAGPGNAWRIPMARSPRPPPACRVFPHRSGRRSSSAPGLYPSCCRQVRGRDRRHDGRRVQGEALRRTADMPQIIYDGDPPETQGKHAQVAESAFAAAQVMLDRHPDLTCVILTFVTGDNP